MALGQGPRPQRVNVTFDTPYELKVGEYVLPAGQYVLCQINDREANLFSLFPNDPTRSPLATLMTVRAYYPATESPDETRLVLRADESSPMNLPVWQGWKMPGLTGWEIVGVVAEDNHLLPLARWLERHKERASARR